MDYAGCWKDLKVRRVVFLAVFVGGWFLEGYADIRFHLWGYEFLGLGLLWVVASLAAGFWLASWPCPRCGKPYFVDFPYFSNPFAIRCLHCGLRFGVLSDPAAPPEWAQDGSAGKGAR